MSQAMELALGTVQFGLAYGAVGSGQTVAEAEVERILAAAWQQGVRTLDTAAAYGDIEARLARLCGTLGFRIISKIRPLSGLSQAQALAAVQMSIEQSRQRLGERLNALLFHSAADLLAAGGPALWEQAEQQLKGSGIRLGVSCYGPEELLTLRQRQDIRIAQLPANALDQRLQQTLQGPQAELLTGVELHVRSAFLQGLLLAPERGAQRVPAAAPFLQAWQKDCQAQDLSPTVAALGLVKALPQVHSCVVGVESLAQWQDIAGAWQHARPLHRPHLACDLPEAYDPRLWPKP
ncbi:aldo/keto reductase [Roseateles sp. PN1]|uniref:aldo/keto reductase n=1 Tax=Roseateles sp. PN1 TaxID=3137372 RepID=UPI00313A3BB4